MAVWCEFVSNFLCESGWFSLRYYNTIVNNWIPFPFAFSAKGVLGWEQNGREVCALVDKM